MVAEINEKKATGQNVAYVRVSTIHQNEARQVEALKKYQIHKWFIDKESGKNTKREEFKRMMEYLREGDTLYVHDFSRLARNTMDLLEISKKLQKKGVNLVSDKEDIDTSTPVGSFMFTMIAAVAEFERTNLLERQREGIELAKKRGVYKGRKPVEVKDFEVWYERYKSGQLTKVEFAKRLGVSRPTLYKLIKDYEDSSQAQK